MSDLDLLVEMFTKVGQPVVESEQQQGTGTKVELQLPDFSVSPAWLSAKDAANDAAGNRFIQQLDATGIPREFNINNFRRFIKSMNNATNVASYSRLDISQRLSRLNVLRVIYNLIGFKSGRQSVAGFNFENFLAIFYGGEVLPPTDDGINDVSIGAGGKEYSLKFRKDKTISGSTFDLVQSIKKSSVGKVNYIVGVKKGKSVTFLLVQIGLDNLIASFGVEPNPKSVSYQKIRKLLVLAKNATQLESEMQSFKFGATDPVYGGAKDLGTIDASDALKVSKLVLEDVNKQFENLIKNLQILTKEVNELTYVAKDKKQRKTKAGTSADAAGATKKSAEDIK